MKFRFLGTGTSVGVPQIGCSCKVCTSLEPRDTRRRCGAHVETATGAFLIDTPPEMREACVAYGIRRVDAVVLTHAHMDHVAGFDDVRRFNTLNGTRIECDPNSPGANGRTFRIIGKPMTCYAMKETEEQMHRIFPYVGSEGGKNGLFRPQIFFNTDDVFTLAGLTVTRLRVEHGFPCCGYLIEGEGQRLCYISDCHRIPDEALDKMKGVDALVLDCLRERPHPTHLTLEAALEYAKRAEAKRTYLTHFCHDFTHEEWLQKLAGTTVEPAYDGLEIAP